jgi:hypothetical protein
MTTSDAVLILTEGDVDTVRKGNERKLSLLSQGGTWRLWLRGWRRGCKRQVDFQLLWAVSGRE